jgi:hypothetical protein
MVVNFSKETVSEWLQNKYTDMYSTQNEMKDSVKVGFKRNKTERFAFGKHHQPISTIFLRWNCSSIIITYRIEELKSLQQMLLINNTGIT